MASEQELRAARRAHADKLTAGAFPNRFRVDEEKRKKRAELLALAASPGRCAELPTEDSLLGNEPHYPLFGRVVAKRGPFLVIRTEHGDAQALVRPEMLAESEATDLKLVDLADHVAVEGPAMRTKTGALAVRAARYQHVSKALLPPPAKWHGLKDVEKRYRERYVDMFANPPVQRVFRARGRMIQELRRFLDGLGFIEVETPVLQSVRGGATARPFRTHHNALDLELYMRVAPELHLKRLLVGGFDRVYEMARVFRNEGISTRHNPEFTILEFYQAYATYEEVMNTTEAMLRSVDAAIRADFPDLTQDRTVDLEAKWARITMRQAIIDRVERAGEEGLPATIYTEALDATAVMDGERLDAVVRTLRDRVEREDQKVLAEANTYGDQVFALFELVAEPALTTLYRAPDGQRSVPVFVTEFPFEVSPLSRRNDDDPAWVDRFELFIDGRELVNAFSELNDPDDQASRFQAQLEARARGNEEAMDFDADYIRALSHGMPPAGGFGLGVDRLAMLLLGQPSIRDVLLFPLLRPEAADSGTNE